MNAASPLILACLALAARPAGADVIVVDDDGPADFPQINLAIQAAADGDTILVRSGTYQPAPIVGRVVSIVADAGALVIVEGYVGVLGLPAGATVVLAGLTVVAQEPAHRALFLHGNAGAVRVQDCILRGYAPPRSEDDSLPLVDGGPAVMAQDCADVSLVRCEIAGGEGQSAEDPFFCLCWSGAGGAGIHALASRVALHDCVVEGGRGGEASYAGAGGTGIRLESSALFASGGSVRGGDGGAFQDVIWLCEGGGDGIFADAGSVARLADVPVAGGAETWLQLDGKCEDGDAFAGAGTFEQLAPPARGVAGPSVAREGELSQLVVRGAPGDVVHLAGPAAAGHLFLAAHNGVWLLRYPPPVPAAPAGTIDATGTLVVRLPARPLAPGREERTELYQALHLSPHGGAAVGAPYARLVIDDAF